jgi:hypothetical protein
MSALPGVLGCRTLRRTSSSTPRIQPPAVARWHTLIHGLATAIHETSELARMIHELLAATADITILPPPGRRDLRRAQRFLPVWVCNIRV